MNRCVGMIYCLFTLPALAQPAIDVIAVDYPPFTSPSQQDSGIAFQLLRLQFPNAKFKPLFVPPKRAYTIVTNDPWCASFYPVRTPNAKTVVLSKHEIEIGLIRLHEETEFQWQNLNSFAGQRVALLRTSDTSPFAHQFTNAGIQIQYVETIEQGMKLVLLRRVHFALYDNYSFAQLEDATKHRLQFSSSSLIKTPIILYLNRDCEQAQLLIPVKEE